MFSRRLHPTPSGFAFGLAVIAFWALIWIWFFAQLSRPHPAVGNAVAEARPPLGAAFGWRISTGLRLAPPGWRNLALSLEGAVSRWDGLKAAENPSSFQRPPDAVTALSILGGLVFVFGR